MCTRNLFFLKEYIRTFINPSMTVDFLYAPELHHAFNDTLIDNIEKQTKAVLVTEEPGLIFIRGNELTAALADSLLTECLRENSVDESPNNSILLDSTLQEKFKDEDLESSSDNGVTNYSDEVKRALLVTVSNPNCKKFDQSDDIYVTHTDLSGTKAPLFQSDNTTSDSDVEGRRDIFKALARSKDYTDAEADAVIKQNPKGLEMSDAEFIRNLSTSRKLKSTTTQSSVSRLFQVDLSRCDQDDSTDEDDVIDLRSDVEQLSETDDSRTAINSNGDEYRYSAETQRQKNNNKKKKKARQWNAAQQPRSSVPVDRDPTVMMSTELSSANMEKVLSRKEKRRLAAARVDAARSRSPLKSSDAKTMLVLPPNKAAQGLPAAAKHHGYEFQQQGRNMATATIIDSAVMNAGADPDSLARQMVFGAGPKLRYIVLDGSNVAMT